ncbi:DUF6428 family protein [Persicobacter psychrovividus]|uniref:Uncharacterized protein n=1 Tax=Persicobacter psychrovividus TaxID=387638 RepID=A0ABM7VAI2_9BACT|nr:hypothetical protein PEPS_01850 [Persicobacter psychrovividus]
MTLSELKEALKGTDALHIQTPEGTAVPAHFHLTEAGVKTKKFLDCGGTLQENTTICFQLWVADDLQHRLSGEKVLKIIEDTEKVLELPDAEVEVEYQQQTIGLFQLKTIGRGKFMLSVMTTDCLAPDRCGITPREEKPRIRMNTLGQISGQTCDPNTGCC